MTAADPFLLATPTYLDATRRPFKSGEALQVFNGRGQRVAFQIIPSLLAFMSLLAIAGVVLGFVAEMMQ